MFKLFIFIALAAALSGCAERTKVYDATSENKDGLEVLEKVQIKYICRDVSGVSAMGLWLTDVTRDDCFFATDVIKNENNISFKQVKDEAIIKFAFKPKYTFWQQYGKWFSPFIIIIIVAMAILISAAG